MERSEVIHVRDVTLKRLYFDVRNFVEDCFVAPLLAMTIFFEKSWRALVKQSTSKINPPSETV